MDPASFPSTLYLWVSSFTYINSAPTCRLVFTSLSDLSPSVQMRNLSLSLAFPHEMSSLQFKPSIEKLSSYLFLFPNLTFYLLFSITVDNSPSCLLLGPLVWLSSSIQTPHLVLQAASKSCKFFLNIMSRMWPFLSTHTAKTLVQAVSSHLYYSNSLFSGLDKCNINLLICIHNIAAKCSQCPGKIDAIVRPLGHSLEMWEIRLNSLSQ